MAHSATSESVKKLPTFAQNGSYPTNGTKFGKERIEDGAFFTFYILLQVLLLYSMYNPYEPVYRN